MLPVIQQVTSSLCLLVTFHAIQQLTRSLCYLVMFHAVQYCCTGDLFTVVVSYVSCYPVEMYW